MSNTFSIVFSNLCLRSLSAAVQGSAYLLTHRSWISRIGTAFRKCSFSRPRRLVATRPAFSSNRRCFITPKRVIGSRPSSALSVWPSSLNIKQPSTCRIREGSEHIIHFRHNLNTPSIHGTFPFFIKRLTNSLVLDGGFHAKVSAHSLFMRLNPIVERARALWLSLHFCPLDCLTFTGHLSIIRPWRFPFAKL